MKKDNSYKVAAVLRSAFPVTREWVGKEAWK